MLGNSITILERLGKGGYGLVHKCHDERNNVAAVKCVPTDKNGIPGLMEVSIMSTISHPHINRALRIHPTSKMLYIFQDIALSDLHHYVRNEGPPSAERLRGWLHKICQGVSCLHSQKIIHADIKASNVLLYTDDNVKLTDFTLSCKSWDTDYTHSVCTSTHRPLECYTKEGWSFPLDIWSLGCTFYEIAYGESLFPSQSGKKEDRSVSKKKELECLEQWQHFEQTGNHAASESCLSPRYDNLAPSPLNNLIMKMLKTDKTQRVTIEEILKDPYFEGLRTCTYTLFNCSLASIPEGEERKAERLIGSHSGNPLIRNIALQLYRKSVGCNKLGIDHKSVICVWMATKLLYGNPSATIPLHQVLAGERILCKYINFRLIT